MREIQVSVVMPCRNDGSTLFEATASIGLEAQPQVELIVVDDGSDDGETLRALEALESRGICVLHTAGIFCRSMRTTGSSRRISLRRRPCWTTIRSAVRSIAMPTSSERRRGRGCCRSIPRNACS